MLLSQRQVPDMQMKSGGKSLNILWAHTEIYFSQQEKREVLLLFMQYIWQVGPDITMSLRLLHVKLAELVQQRGNRQTCKNWLLSTWGQ